VAWLVKGTDERRGQALGDFLHLSSGSVTGRAIYHDTTEGVPALLPVLGRQAPFDK